MSDINTAALDLYEAIFDGRRDIGSILVGQHKLTVYVFGKYHGTKPQIWQGYHVEWHINVGLPVALDAIDLKPAPQHPGEAR